MITKETNEDLEQEVYIKAINNSDKYKEQGNFKNWIGTIAKNVSKDYLKSSYNKHKNLCDSEEYTLLNIADRKATPEAEALKKERQEKILAAVYSLKPKFKEVIILCEFSGLSYEDAAKKLNCPLGTVKSRIYNAKKELATILNDLL